MPNYWKCLESHCAIAATVNSPLMYNTEHLLKTWPHMSGLQIHRCTTLWASPEDMATHLWSTDVQYCEHLLKTWPHISGLQSTNVQHCEHLMKTWPHISGLQSTYVQLSASPRDMATHLWSTDVQYCGHLLMTWPHIFGLQSTDVPLRAFPTTVHSLLIPQPHPPHGRLKDAVHFPTSVHTIH